jgi:hypothetical protein
MAANVLIGQIHDTFIITAVERVHVKSSVSRTTCLHKRNILANNGHFIPHLPIYIDTKSIEQKRSTNLHKFNFQFSMSCIFELRLVVRCENHFGFCAIFRYEIAIVVSFEVVSTIGGFYATIFLNVIMVVLVATF